jgi:hypothetical protein
MTQPAYATNACDDLIDQIWQGEISEQTFFERGMQLGMSLEQLGSIVADIREEDGTF